MTPKIKTSNGGSRAAVAETNNGSNPERERIFNAYRQWGYLEGDLDPLGFLRPRETPELEHEGDYAREARAIYSSTIGVEINHIYSPERRRWIYEQMESPSQGFEITEEIQQRILDLLIRADVFEQVMQQRYLGSKRFSLEGVTALIPLVDEVLDTAAQRGAVELVMGMSHRGRLNVIAHVAQRPPQEIFAGFEDVDPRSVLGSGDVKYHMGATGEYSTRSGGKVHIHLVSNPSHLEAVDPVTVGRTRAKQDRTGEGGREKYLPLLVHGDAAFAGQGILAETMNYADLPGYTVGGTIHVVVNNLLGFTTSYTEEHSTRFAACIARRQSIPIFHVNGEDVDAVVRVARIATEYRYKFGTDVVIDLIGYRRHGHSEVDDPTITQPLLYKKIKEHPPLWEIYADDIGATDAQSQAAAIKAEFEASQKKASSIKHKPLMRDLPKYWNNYFGGLYRPEFDVETGLTAEELSDLTQRLTTYPEGFHIHPKVKKLLEQRAEMGAGKATGGLRHGRGSRLREPGEIRYPRTLQRTRLPPRHLQSAPLRPHRYRERKRIRAAGKHRDPVRLAAKSTTRRSPKPESLASNTATAATILNLSSSGKPNSVTSSTSPKRSSTSSSAPAKPSGTCSPASSCCCPTATKARDRNIPAPASSASFNSPPSTISRSRSPAMPRSISISCAVRPCAIGASP